MRRQQASTNIVVPSVHISDPPQSIQNSNMMSINQVNPNQRYPSGNSNKSDNMVDDSASVFRDSAVGTDISSNLSRSSHFSGGSVCGPNGKKYDMDNHYHGQVHAHAHNHQHHQVMRNMISRVPHPRVF